MKRITKCAIEVPSLELPLATRIILATVQVGLVWLIAVGIIWLFIRLYFHGMSTQEQSSSVTLAAQRQSLSKCDEPQGSDKAVVPWRLPLEELSSGPKLKMNLANGFVISVAMESLIESGELDALTLAVFSDLAESPDDVVLEGFTPLALDSVLSSNADVQNSKGEAQKELVFSCCRTEKKYLYGECFLKDSQGNLIQQFIGTHQLKDKYFTGLAG